MLMTMGSPTVAAELKDGNTCGCAADAYAVYGAGQDSCAVYTTEFEANLDSKDIDASFGQTMGWIAGYVSAINRQAADNDVYNIDVSYMSTLIAKWCRANPDRMLSDAMDVLTDKRLKSNQLFSSE